MHCKRWDNKTNIFCFSSSWQIQVAVWWLPGRPQFLPLWGLAAFPSATVWWSGIMWYPTTLTFLGHPQTLVSCEGFQRLSLTTPEFLNKCPSLLSLWSRPPCIVCSYVWRKMIATMIIVVRLNTAGRIDRRRGAPLNIGIQSGFNFNFILTFCRLSTIQMSFLGFPLVRQAPWFFMFFLALRSERVRSRARAVLLGSIRLLIVFQRTVLQRARFSPLNLYNIRLWRLRVSEDPNNIDLRRSFVLTKSSK